MLFKTLVVLVLKTAADTKCCCQAFNLQWEKWHTSHQLAALHWLPASFRIDFKIVLIVFKTLNGLAPAYMICSFPMTLIDAWDHLAGPF